MAKLIFDQDVFDILLKNGISSKSKNRFFRIVERKTKNSVPIPTPFTVLEALGIADTNKSLRLSEFDKVEAKNLLKISTSFKTIASYFDFIKKHFYSEITNELLLKSIQQREKYISKDLGAQRLWQHLVRHTTKDIDLYREFIIWQLTTNYLFHHQIEGLNQEQKISVIKSIAWYFFHYPVEGKTFHINRYNTSYLPLAVQFCREIISNTAADILKDFNKTIKLHKNRGIGDGLDSDLIHSLLHGRYTSIGLEKITFISTEPTQKILKRFSIYKSFFDATKNCFKNDIKTSIFSKKYLFGKYIQVNKSLEFQKITKMKSVDITYYCKSLSC